MTLDPMLLAEWKQWIGRSEDSTEVLEVGSLRRFAAALGETLDVEETMPSLGHWAFFLPVVDADQIGGDGHPLRGGFLPPITLPVRMFAAAEMTFHAPLLLGVPATRRSTVVALTHKTGRTGDLVLVEVVHEISQSSLLRVHERQTILYRDPVTLSNSAVVPAAISPDPGAEQWHPREVDLFRFSAATFNSHRIHYDWPYATSEEGYPNLVVHGPFTAARLYGCARRSGGPITSFSFRAIAPLFCRQTVLLTAGDEANAFNAVRCDAVTAMSAKVARAI